MNKTRTRLFFTMAAVVVIMLFSLASVVSGQEASPKDKAKELYEQGVKQINTSLDEESLYKALDLFEQSAKLDPKSEDTWIRISWTYFLLGDDLPKETSEQKKKRQDLFEKGQAAGEKAMEINPKSIGGMYWYTVNLASAGEMRGILSSLSLAGTLFGNMSRVDRRDPYYQYGATRRFGSELFIRIPTWLSERFGFTPEYLEEDLLWNIDKWPNYFTNYVYLARVYVWAGDMPKALNMLEHVLTHDPGDMPEEIAENEKQQKIARRMWKEYTGKKFPEK